MALLNISKNSSFLKNLHKLNSLKYTKIIKKMNLIVNSVNKNTYNF
jgi:hypothetical protein